MDFMATIIELSNAKYPATYKGNAIKPLQGRSFASAFISKNAQGHEAIFNEHFGAKYVRHEGWKLVARNRESWHLYKIDDDETESNDLSKQHPDVVQKMDVMWQEWAKQNQVLPKPAAK